MLAFLKNENPAFAGLLVHGGLWGCAQSLESVVPTSENKSLGSPRFLEAEIRGLMWSTSFCWINI